ncbi:MAG TPA: zf-HC2 domain-containing protein [Pyrinomonadaceae bacterium]|nr:zf-HC2 domain-containing protein [Pyrinomonadaceae bacterium]
MTEHLREEQLEQFRARTLPAGELLSVGGHLAACAQCRARLGAPQAARLASRVEHLRAGLHEGESTEHLAYEQLAAYVDDELSDIDREIVEGHLLLCGRCESEADELKSLAAAMSAAPAPPTAARRSLRERLSTFFGPSNVFVRRPAFGVAAALAALVLFAALLFLRGGNAPAPSNEIVKTVPTPAQTPARVEATPAPTPEVEATPTQDATPAPPPLERRQPQAPALSDGGQSVTLAANGGVEGLGRLTPEEERAVTRALTTGRVEVPAGLSDLARTDGSLMGGTPAGARFEVEGPAGVVVRDARPAFRWTRLADADAYVVTVYDAAYKEVTKSPRLAVNSWTPAQALPRGGSYSWEVAAFRDGRQLAQSPAPPAPEARFKVLGERDAARLAATLARHPSSHLVRGTAYARAGLLAEAEREFQQLLRANPRSPLAKKLLRGVRETR